MFRSVVISHDGSKSVEGAVHWLEPLLGETHAHVELFGRRDAPSSCELNSKAHLEELAQELTAAGAEVEILGEDVELAEATQHKLVVVHDPDLAIRLLRETTASLFFTPEGVRPHRPERILVGLDGSSYAEEILPLLVPFARAFETRVELVRVAPEDPELQAGSLMSGTRRVTTRCTILASLERAKAFLEERGVEVVARTADAGDVSRRLLEAADAESGRGDVVAVSTHGHNLLARWLFGSCAESLIRAGKTPVLIRNTREG
jgi:nucleotide-binding universal stress UspA family protein